MRILLDECVPRSLGRDLRGHDVRTVGQQGWHGVSNGQLIRLASHHFDAFLRVDKLLEAEQRGQAGSMSIITLRARSNRIDHLRDLAPAVLSALEGIRPGEHVTIGARD